MRNMLDFSSWTTAPTTLLSLIVVSIKFMCIRPVFMQSFQRRCERGSRQINEWRRRIHGSGEAALSGVTLPGTQARVNLPAGGANGMMREGHVDVAAVGMPKPVVVGAGARW